MFDIDSDFSNSANNNCYRYLFVIVFINLADRKKGQSPYWRNRRYLSPATNTYE